MINLFINYYKAKTEERQNEIDFCFQKNSRNKIIDRLILFSDLKDCALFCDEVVNIERPTYQDFFDAANKYPNDINIIANSDIFFDETIELVKSIRENEVYCLTRWEWNDGNITDFNKMHGAPHEWSQDAWIFKGACRLKDCSRVVAINQDTGKYDTIPFTMGVPGCDNHISWKFKQAGYQPLNPSKTIKAIHVHKQTARDYGHPYRITGGEGSKWGRLLNVPQV